MAKRAKGISGERMAMAKARWQVCAWVHGERHVTVYRGGVLGNFREPVSLTAPPRRIRTPDFIRLLQAHFLPGPTPIGVRLWVSL